MTTPTHAGRNLFVNLPVADVAASTAFFEKLGFPANPAFSDEHTTCFLFGEQAFVMLANKDRFAQIAKLPIADARTQTIGLYSFSVTNRDDVNALVDTAIDAGATEADAFEDLGFMVSRAFYDLDGHAWNVIWMDPAAAAQ